MKNSRQVFSRIYDQYVDKIYRFIYLKVNLVETAEDLTAETFIKGWQAFQIKQAPDSDDRIENMPAFLYRIARNLVIDYYRQKEKFPISPIDTIEDPRTDLEGKVAVGSDIEMVKRALSRLNQDYQDVIIWHYLDDLAIPEVAKLLDRSEEATRVLLSRALKSLKDELRQSV